MFSFGLKLWSVNTGAYRREAMRLYDAGLCGYVELYVVPNTSDTRPLWQELDIPFVVHAPHSTHGLNFAKPERFAENKRLAEEAFRWADDLQVEHVIFHAGLDGKLDEAIRQISALNNAMRSRILVENKPYQTINDAQIICVGHTSEQIERIVRECGVGFCFDVGHGVCSANSRGQDAWREIEAYQKLQPTMYHLSDNDWTSPIDGHKNIGSGNFDFKRILSLIDTTRKITLETEKRSQDSLRDFEADTANLWRKRVLRS